MASNRNKIALNDFAYKDIKKGMEFSFERLVDKKLVKDFSKMSWDTNPLHMNAKYASTTVFGDRIAHGMLLGSFFSTLVGMLCPGKRSLYVSQSLRFRKPIKIGNFVMVSGRVIHKSDATETVTLASVIKNKSGEIIVDGEAVVKML